MFARNSLPLFPPKNLSSIALWIRSMNSIMAQMNPSKAEYCNLNFKSFVDNATIHSIEGIGQIFYRNVLLLRMLLKDYVASGHVEKPRGDNIQNCNCILQWPNPSLRRAQTNCFHSILTAAWQAGMWDPEGTCLNVIHQAAMWKQKDDQANHS